MDISKIIEEVIEMHPYKVSGDFDTYSEYNQGWEDACVEIIERIVQ